MMTDDERQRLNHLHLIFTRMANTSEEQMRQFNMGSELRFQFEYGRYSAYKGAAREVQKLLDIHN